ncbi:MAG: class I SAM-dependent methyltransferase [Sulfurospirillaceae bacterium]|nr:class I SAM-dependent methyltransferase [Sulfurospirillaceae bacterium]
MNNTTFYRNAYAKHGVSAMGVNWHSKETQEMRFAIIAQLLKSEKIAHSTILDAGCGFGDLYLYLHQQGLRPKHYVGVDVMDEFIQIAHKRLARFSNCKLMSHLQI